jgi:hypothetical protein
MVSLHKDICLCATYWSHCWKLEIHGIFLSIKNTHLKSFSHGIFTIDAKSKAKLNMTRSGEEINKVLEQGTKQALHK